MGAPSPLAASLLAVLAVPSPQDHPLETRREGISLPEGPAARALAGVGPGTQPRELARELPGLAGLLEAAEPWSSPATWAAWAELVEDEAAAEVPAPARRASLCLLARAHGRAEDAWKHLAAAGGDPGWVAAVLPRLFPGVAPDVAPAAGGRPAPLPDGARLAPLVPPGSGDVMAGRRPRAEMALRGLEVGAGRVDLRLVLEPAGVEVELTHAGGEALTLEVLLPVPEGFVLRVEYVDWIRTEDLGRPRRVTLSPDDGEPRQIFGRFEPRRERLPATPLGPLPAGAELGGLWLEPAPGEAAGEAIEAAAAALGRLAGVCAGVRVDPPGEPAPFPGIVAHLPPGEAAARRLARLAGAAEAWRLARDAP